MAASSSSTRRSYYYLPNLPWRSRAIEALATDASLTHTARATCEIRALRLARLRSCIASHGRDHVRGTVCRKTASLLLYWWMGEGERPRYVDPFERIFANSDLLPLISNTICTLTAQCTYLAQALTLSLARPGQPHCLSSIEWSSLLISQLCLRPSGGENF